MMTERGKIKLFFWLSGGIILTLAFLIFWIRFNAEPEDASQAEIAVHDDADLPDQGPTQEEAEQKFAESAGKTLSMYENIKYFINKNTVNIVIDLDSWNATADSDRRDFMNEIFALVRTDAVGSGILQYSNIDLTFMTSDYENAKYFKIERE